jgi:hypothetical protein
MSGPCPRTAMLEYLRRPMIGRDQNVRKRFVVAQHDIKARPQPFDQIGLKQQCFGFGAGDDEFERTGGCNHPLDARVEAGRSRVSLDPLSDILCLADIKYVAASVDHAVDAGPRWRQLGIVNNGGTAGGERSTFFVKAKRYGFFFVGQRQRLFFVFFGGFRFRRDFWFGRAAHAFASWGLSPSLGTDWRYRLF